MSDLNQNIGGYLIQRLYDNGVRHIFGLYNKGANLIGQESTSKKRDNNGGPSGADQGSKTQSKPN